MWSTLALGACTVDAADPEPLTCEDTVESRTYRIDRVRLPVEGDGLDLDRDGTVDNRAATILAYVFEAYDDQEVAAAWQAQLDARLADQTTWKVRVATCSLDGSARVAVVGADDADVVEATGRMHGSNYLVVEEGVGATPLGALADLSGAAGDGWHAANALGLRADVRDGELSGVLGGGFAPSYLEVIADAFLPFLNQLLDAGDTSWGAAIDADGDGEIELDELLATDLFRLLMRPDLDTVGEDGDADALSFGFGIHGLEIVEDR